MNTNIANKFCLCVLSEFEQKQQKNEGDWSIVKANRTRLRHAVNEIKSCCEKITVENLDGLIAQGALKSVGEFVDHVSVSSPKPKFSKFS